MRYFKILALHFEDVLQERSRAFVYFLLNIVNPLILILFWSGATSNSSIIAGFTRNQINTYYVLLVIVVTIVVSHIEESIAKADIRDGLLVSYLLRPFSYLTFKFFQELPHRVLQGIFGIISYVILSNLIPGVSDAILTPTTVVIIALAYLLCFLMQASIGLLAFWIIEISGVLNMGEVIRAVFSGILVPIVFLPDYLANIAYITPYPYIIYFPVISLQGLADTNLQMWVMSMQIMWITFFYILYKVLWHFGIRQFSGVGQ